MSVFIENVIIIELNIFQLKKQLKLTNTTHEKKKLTSHKKNFKNYVSLKKKMRNIIEKLK